MDRRCRFAIAAEIGFSTATLASMRLLDVSTASIASGIPCPLIFGDPYFAISPIMSPPITGIADDPEAELIIYRAAELRRNTPR